MTDKTIQVVALVVANDTLTFYRVDGSVFTVTQGDPRGGAMSDEFFAQKRLGKEVINLVVNRDDMTVTHLSSQKRSPLLRFFRALKADVEKLFGSDTEQYENAFTEESHEAAAQKVRDVAARLFNDSTPQLNDLPVRMVYSEEPMNKDETIIAVTADGIVPGVENLTDQFQAGEEGKAPSEGPDNLIKRLATMSAKRGHTAKELMDFIKLIDLPILSDGAFFAYKRLLHQGEGVYVDPYTRLVHQRIGDIVQMDEKLVDPSKRYACSQGLHIGSRHYMGGFHASAEGSVTMLVLVQPEDAIAVPPDEKKARVCRYLILADLSDKAHNLVNNSQRMDSCQETMDVVAQILAGARPTPLGIVNIGGNNGNSLTYTINGQEYSSNISLADATLIAGGKSVATTQKVVPTRTIDDASQGNNAGIIPVKVRDKSFKVSPAAAKAKAAQTASPRQIEADRLVDLFKNGGTNAIKIAAITSLKTLKKKSKVSWDKLGVTNSIVASMEQLLSAPVVQPKQSNPVPSTKKTEPMQTAQALTGTRQDRARAMWDSMMNSSNYLPNRKHAAQQLRNFKKSAKVSWDALGLDKVNVEAELKKLLD